MVENKLETLKDKLNLAAQAYWQEYFSQNGEQDNAIIWLRNDTTGEMFCLTKGNYTHQLSSFISRLS